MEKDRALNDVRSADCPSGCGRISRSRASARGPWRSARRAEVEELVHVRLGHQAGPENHRSVSSIASRRSIEGRAVRLISNDPSQPRSLFSADLHARIAWMRRRFSGCRSDLAKSRQSAPDSEDEIGARRRRNSRSECATNRNAGCACRIPSCCSTPSRRRSSPQGPDVEVRFNVPENSARLLLAARCKEQRRAHRGRASNARSSALLDVARFQFKPHSSFLRRTSLAHLSRSLAVLCCWLRRGLGQRPSRSW